MKPDHEYISNLNRMRTECERLIKEYEEMIARSAPIAIGDNDKDKEIATSIARQSGGRIGELRIKIAQLDDLLEKANRP